MKTDIDVIDDIYNYLKGSQLAEEVTGKLCKGRRPSISDAGKAYKPTGRRSRAVGVATALATKTGTEDIVISVVTNFNGQIQEVIVNVNIYVCDKLRETWYDIDTIRVRQLAAMASELLQVHQGDGYRFTLESQRVIASQDTNEHVINNQLNYKQVNN